MVEFADIADVRALTAKEVGDMVTILRSDKEWTQETLAEISGLTVRTIQRVERGESSSVDTRRALARAFELPNLEFFDREHELPNADKIRQFKEQLDKDTTEIKLTRLDTGQLVREYAEGYDACTFHELVELETVEQEMFAELQDYFRDYGDIYNHYSAGDKLKVNSDFQRMIEGFKAAGYGLFGSRRQVTYQDREPSGKAPLMYDVIYVFVGSVEMTQVRIRVPKQVRLGF